MKRLEVFTWEDLEWVIALLAAMNHNETLAASPDEAEDLEEVMVWGGIINDNR